uniref:XK-related protein n=1 Tax=Lutzomyia longipalpis TaxID=7200 RepID=A0A7G3B391_LUTLO
MDELDGVPKRILFYPVKTRTQIVASILIPTFMELCVYVVLTTADITITVRHFQCGDYLWGALTLTFLCLPALLCFIIIIASPWQWPDQSDCAETNSHWKFFLRQLFNVLLFPLGAIWRFCRRIFWCIEALFHERESYERHHAVGKAIEPSPFELYHFLQAFTQAAPQIILQMNILLREDVFRDYETTIPQVISVVFSLIKMGMTVECFQRFESQKIVGRNYPWQTTEQCAKHRKKLEQTKFTPKKYYREISGLSNTAMEFPDVMKGFEEKFGSNANGEHENGVNENGGNCRKTLHVDRENFNMDSAKILRKASMDSQMDDGVVLRHSSTEDDGIRKSTVTLSTTTQNANVPEDGGSPHLSARVPTESQLQEAPIWDAIERDTTVVPTTLPAIEEDGELDNFDAVPKSAPPPRPDLPPFRATQFFLEPLNRFSTIKDMFLVNAELYIKENVPRLPQKVLNHEVRTVHRGNNRESYNFNDNSNHEIIHETTNEDGISLPTRRKMINGIEQDDILGKTVAFMGWVLFLLMRMLALSLFAVFYVKATGYLCLSHYLLMLIWLFIETRFHEKAERDLFYIFLAYVFIFSIIEFKIKFRNIRIWYLLYCGIVLTQNVVITLWWYITDEFQSWWFHYLFTMILLSGALSIGCLVTYYIILKPRDKVLFEITNQSQET